MLHRRTSRLGIGPSIAGSARHSHDWRLGKCPQQCQAKVQQQPPTSLAMWARCRLFVAKSATQRRLVGVCGWIDGGAGVSSRKAAYLKHSRGVGFGASALRALFGQQFKFSHPIITTAPRFQRPLQPNPAGGFPPRRCLASPLAASPSRRRGHPCRCAWRWGTAGGDNRVSCPPPWRLRCKPGFVCLLLLVAS